MKRIVSLALSILILLSLTACGAPATEPAPNDESAQAIEYGFVPAALQSDYDSTITYAEYCGMLRNMLKLCKEDLADKWDATAANALNDTAEMKRDDGMLATYYAANLLGMYTANGNWWDLNNLCGESWGDDVSWDYPAFPDYQQPCLFNDIPGRVPGWDHMTGAYFFCMGQYSSGSGQPLFTCDKENRTMHCNEPFTRIDAILAAARLYECTFTAEDDPARAPTDWETTFLADADARRASILTSASSIVKGAEFVQGKTYNGNTYYVSSHGDDGNNGLSPQTAWATLKKVNSTKLAAGSAVLFERGDAWYGTLLAKAGVTYSAYGDGDKPRFIGAQDVGADKPAKWTLYYEGDDGEKIWKYQENLPQVAAIFFNDGSTYASQLQMDWKPGQGYVTSDGTTALDVSSQLSNDLMYFSAIDLSSFQLGDYIPDLHLTGPLYLRCDEGNPAEALGEIHLSLEGNGAEVRGNQATLDNLCFQYYGCCGINCGGDTYSGTLIQNCEIGWCGGFFREYEDNGMGLWKPCITGGAVHICGTNNTAVSNYIHDCDSKGFIIVYQVQDDTVNQNISISGNLIEHCCTALCLNNFADGDNPENKYVFRDIKFADNYALHTGEYWGYERLSSYADTEANLCDIDFGTYRNRSENVSITDNVFYLSHAALVYGNIPSDNMPTFSGNTYAQYNRGMMAIWNSYRYGFPDTVTYAEHFVRDILGDQTGMVQDLSK